jgi:hypothetical protein
LIEKEEKKGEEGKRAWRILARVPEQMCLAVVEAPQADLPPGACGLFEGEPCFVSEQELDEMGFGPRCEEADRE